MTLRYDPTRASYFNAEDDVPYSPLTPYVLETFPSEMTRRYGYDPRGCDRSLHTLYSMLARLKRRGSKRHSSGFRERRRSPVTGSAKRRRRQSPAARPRSQAPPSLTSLTSFIAKRQKKLSP